ncbi:VOC family protein [Cognatishimia sp. MH4019]|uniref:VOC family protein n=1 Tax=Cognatishimia sp. MH4019 TaxID=2854030 RepID=UPI001CD4F7BD|nr:VOC family protein [Cognatishimia sp. MH4019]
MSYTPANPVVWTEIPVRDLEKASTFYAAVTGMEMQLNKDGPQPIVFFNADKGVSGHLYEGAPATKGGPTVHLAAEGTVEQMKARVWDAGGKVVSDPISIPAGQFIYCLDLDGNSFGLFEVA